MTNDTTPAPEGVTPEQVAALENAISSLRDGIACAEGDMARDLQDAEHTGERPDLSSYSVALDVDEARIIINRIEALAAELAAQKARADALRRSYDELYADALADAQSDAQGFEGDLWKLLRDYLTKLNLDWSDYTDDGITAEQAIEHIRECMDDETARADAAEAKVARLVEAAIRVAASLAAAISLLDRGGKKAAPSDKMFNQMIVDYKKSLDEARAIIAEVQG